MERRHYLAALGTGLLGGVATVLARGSVRLQEETEEPNVALDNAAIAMPDPPGEEDLPVPESELRQALAQDAKPAIVDPEFASSWADLPEPHGNLALRPNDDVLGVAVDGHARAYPLKLLDRHEVVNDELGNPMLVTYCPVCRSGVVADRRVDGQARTFGVSGYLYQANLVLYDEDTESLWSQLWTKAIRGPETGATLDVLPSRTTTWRDWSDEFPDTEVLLPPPASTTVRGDVSFNYELDIYGDRDRVSERYPEYGPLGDIEWSDTRLRRRDLVLGVVIDEEAVAFSRNDVRGNDPINTTVGDGPVLVTYGGDDTMFAYDRRLDGDVLTFELADGDLLAAGSRWNRLSGRAVDGPYEGETLSAVPSQGPLFWAAWLQFYPETAVYGRDT